MGGVMTTTINASTSGAGGLINTADSSGSLALQTAGTSALNINSSQQITTPNQPAFIAQINANTDATFNSGSYIPFNTTGLNRGSNYSTANYYFTAPVAGVYFFVASLFLTNSAGATGNMQFGLTKNGSFQTAGLDTFNCANITPNDTGGTAQINATGIFTLSAGDIVGVQSRTASVRVYQGHCYFSGYLIG
jgi:hypothetical protein